MMGSAAYNRGSRLVSKEADERMPLATARADRQAHKDEVARLREQIATLERDLRRARKAAKNLEMHKLAGRRPWNVNQTITDMDRTSHDPLESPYLEYYTKATLDHLRERSGFLDMSRLAEGMTGKEGELAVREAVIEESKRWKK